MRIYFEQRELFYVEVEAEDFDTALSQAQDLMDNEDEDFWGWHAKETGQIDIEWHDEEINAMLQD